MTTFWSVMGVVKTTSVVPPLVISSWWDSMLTCSYSQLHIQPVGETLGSSGGEGWSQGLEAAEACSIMHQPAEACCV